VQIHVAGWRPHPRNRVWLIAGWSGLIKSRLYPRSLTVYYQSLLTTQPVIHPIRPVMSVLERVLGIAGLML
jgi:hypothetical protein